MTGVFVRSFNVVYLLVFLFPERIKPKLETTFKILIVNVITVQFRLNRNQINVNHNTRQFAAEHVIKWRLIVLRVAKRNVQ